MTSPALNPHRPGRFRSRPGPTFLLTLALGGAGAWLTIVSPTALRAADATSDPVLAEARAAVAKAVAPATQWDGPTTGPKAAAGKSIVFVATDMNNGGTRGVSVGVEEAAKVLGWKFQILDGKGTKPGETAALEQARALKPDGIVVSGVDAVSQRTTIKACVDAGIKVVSWHAGPKGGVIADPPILWNVSSDPLETAKVAADYVIAKSDGKANAVILTDSVYGMAVTKARTMEERLKQSPGSKVLSFEDSPLAEVSNRMGPLTTSLKQRFGNELVWMVGINDLYFDFASPALQSIGVSPSGPPQFVSAGDGSESAYARIRAGRYQVATVPEPLNLHGWQCADELNRAFAGMPPSGYMTPIHLVTKDNIALDGGKKNIFDPDNHYRDEYRKIWGVK